MCQIATIERAQDDPGRHARTAGDRGADHEWKDDVFDGMRSDAKNLSEYHLRGEQRCRDPCRRSDQFGLRPGAIEGGKNRGSDDDGTERVTKPPIEPEHWESAPGLNASKCQSGDTKRGADGRTRDCRDEHKREDVTDPLKCGFEPTRSAQPPHGGDGFQRVSRGDDECGPGRCVGSEIDDERSNPNRWRKPKPADVESGDGDAGRRPYRRDLLGHERQPKANGGGEDICGDDSDVQRDGATERDRHLALRNFVIRRGPVDGMRRCGRNAG